MKVLLVQPLHDYEGGTRDPTFLPLGLGYIAKALMNEGHTVEILDIWAHQWSQKEVLRKVKDLDHDIIGISGLSTQYSYVKWLISEIKKTTDAPVAVGNALATLTPDIVLENTQADMCVIGEGEITFCNVVKNLGDLSSVKGIFYKKDGVIVRNPPQEYIEDLDTIDFPALELLPVDIYLKYCRIWGTDTKALNMITGRGCPYHCRFCSKTFSGTRMRSVDNIIAEIKHLMKKFDIHGIFFTDELVVLNKKRILELCDKIEPLNIKWNCQGRVNTVTPEVLKRMRQTGCETIGFGVESGSPTILKNMNKKVTVEQSRKAIHDALDMGLLPFVQMMYGYIGENKKTLKETTDFFKDIPFTGVIYLSPTTPLPGTELWDYSIKNGLIKDQVAYLEGLSAGYIPGAKRPFVNLTEFSEKEYFELLKKTEEKILRTQVQNNPGSVLRYFFKYPIFNAKYYLYKIQQHQKGFGLMQTIGKIMKFVKMALGDPALEERSTMNKGDS